jgi:hypothetical protein
MKMLHIAEQYVALHEATQQESAGVAEVERLLDIFTEDVIYQNPRFAVVVNGKDASRTGLSGMLGHTRKVKTEIRQRIVTLAAVALEVHKTLEAKRPEGWKPMEMTAIVVLELEGEKVKRITEWF